MEEPSECYKSKMQYLNDVCSLCLAQNKNLTAQFCIDPKCREILKYIIPEYVFQVAEITKKICIECLNSLNRMYIFRQKCLENIATFDKRIQALKHGYEINKDERGEDEPVHKIEEVQIKSEILDEDDYNLNDELIIKDDSCFSEDGMEDNCSEMKSEHCDNEQPVIKEKQNVFANIDCNAIDKIIADNTPKNTVKNRATTWRIFMRFCETRKYVLDEKRTPSELALILKDWAVNMRKIDGTQFKVSTVKTMWNVTSKLLQEKYYNEFSIEIDPFRSIIFKQARNARDAVRKELQSDPTKRKMSSVRLNATEVNQIINMWNENTPEGLQRKFYHIAAVELSWRCGEAVACLIDFFRIERNNDGAPANRIEYNPMFNKTCQTNSRWLIRNNNTNICPVRLFHKLLLKRGPNIKINRLFLRPNRHWRNDRDHWYDNAPVGRNLISGWTKYSAKAIGLDTNTRRITNQSNRAAAVTQLM